MKAKPLALLLILAGLSLAILMPPEAYPDGRLAVILCATFGFLIALAEGRVSQTYIAGGLAGFASLLAHALFISVDVYRSLEFLTVLWAYYCAFGALLSLKKDPFKPVVICLVALCAIVSGYGLYQYFVGFDEMASQIAAAGSDEAAKAPALNILATRRVFSTFALPGTLWGFLALAIPLHAALWKRGGAARVFAVSGMALLFAAGLLTRSFGFLLGLLVLAAAWFVLTHRGYPWKRVAIWGGVFCVILVVAASAFYASRAEGIADANPLILRAKNWISAWAILASHPWGAGLNTFGVLYPRFMMPAAAETQFAHNTPLQLAAELGFPGIAVGVLLLLLAWLVATSKPLHEVPDSERRREGYNLYLILALVIWGLHNLIDIDVYFASVGLTGVVLLGTLFWAPRETVVAPARSLMALTTVVAVGMLAFAGLTMVSSELQIRAQAEFENKKYREAAATLESAQSLMPLNADLYLAAGDAYLNLYQGKRQPADLDRSMASFQKAVERSPFKFQAHSGLALTLASANRVEEALERIRIARHLYPDHATTQAIARILEKRIAGEPPFGARADRIPRR